MLAQGSDRRHKLQVHRQLPRLCLKYFYSSALTDADQFDMGNMQARESSHYGSSPPTLSSMVLLTRKRGGLFTQVLMVLLLTTCSVVLWHDIVLKQQLSSKQAQLRELALLLDAERNSSLQAKALAEEAANERDALAKGSTAQLSEKDRQLKEYSSRRREALEEAQRGAQAAKLEQEMLLAGALAGMYGDSLVLRHYMSTHAKELQGMWQARLATQRQRGIVMSAGGSTSIPTTNAFVTLHVLRHHLKCSMPVAIMYYGSVGRDNIDEKTKAFFQKHLSGVDFIDVSKLPYPEYHRPLIKYAPGEILGWKVKVLVLYSAPFREVLFLDSESMPLLDPTILFDTEQYRQHGNLFWPAFFVQDVAETHYKTRPLYGTFKLDSPWDKKGPTIHHTEAGQFVFDRSRYWAVLEWLLFVNIRDEVTYRVTHGDKDTFRLAFSLAGEPNSFQLVSLGPAFILSNWKYKGILQLHPNGTAMFNHRTPMKYKRGDSPLPPTTHISPSASGRSLEDPVGRLVLTTRLHPQLGQMVEASEKCKYSLWDWPAAQRACLPPYDEHMLKRQRLPLFKAPQDSHLAAAEAAAAAAFTMLQKS